MELNVLMVDDHPAIIEGYKAILSFNELGFEIKTTTAFNCENAYKIIIGEPKVLFNIVFIDITLPDFPEKKIKSGEDLVFLVRKFMPFAKIVILTSHTEKFILHRLLEECKPDGLLLKNDMHAEEFLIAFTTIINGECYHSETVRKYKFVFSASKKLLDSYNQQIIVFLSQGIMNKTIQEQLHLSKSAVDKRKVIIKTYLGIDKGNDEDILREARKIGLI
ncbi:response regulator transcription factor [Flavobacterium sp.]|uniref:response regulator transcription factor n=1 Tax=Flavobacterium sp. TaxID=239 RepID=UPI003753A70C